MKTNISHFAAIFPCHDPDEIAKWYRDKLGFTISFRWEEPASYVVTHKEEVVSVHFSKTDKEKLQPFCYTYSAMMWTLCIMNDKKMV